MLTLTADAWKLLRHAYGAASDIPELLRQLQQHPGPRQSRGDGPWHALWSALCHQGDVYTASYAALPHIIRIGTEAVGPIDFSFFLLPASIEIARQRGRGPALPESLADAYHGELLRLALCAHRHVADIWDHHMTRSVSAALAAAKGDIDLAELLLELDDDRIARFLAEID
ncbi:MAG TPA: hypothetical protein VM659_14955 [Dongiaceae bacterium]|nr:hypothetical protein [Dongiaceae bacterium]